VSGPAFLGYYFTEFWVAIAVRFHGIDSLIAVMARVPEQMDYLHGTTIFFLPISALVPRFLWPGKPDTGLGDYFRDTFWSTNSGGAIAISQPAEFYLNFGLIGIIVGMVVLAIIHGSVYEYFRKNRTHTAMIILVFSLPYFIAVERDVSLAYATLFKVYLMLFCVFKYLRRGEARMPAAAKPTRIIRRLQPGARPR
jgi:hypothetical protein